MQMLTNESLALRCPVIEPLEWQRWSLFIGDYRAEKRTSFFWNMWIRSLSRNERVKHLRVKLWVKANTTKNEHFRKNLRYLWRLLDKIEAKIPLRVCVCGQNQL